MAHLIYCIILLLLGFTFLDPIHHVYSTSCSATHSGLVIIDRNALLFFCPGLPAGKLITLEAMSGLSKVLLYLDKKNVHLLVVYIFMKIKPFLESVSFILSFKILYDDIYTLIL